MNGWEYNFVDLSKYFRIVDLIADLIEMFYNITIL